MAGNECISAGSPTLSAAPTDYPDNSSSTHLREEQPRKLSKAERMRIRRFYALAFARLLKELRTRLSLTPTEAAARAKMTRAKWMRRENALISPRMDDVLNIAMRFGLDHLDTFERVIDYREEEEEKAKGRRGTPPPK